MSALGFLNLTYRLRVLATLPAMVDLIVKDQLKCTLKEALEKKWGESDEISPWRSRVGQLYASSGKMKALKDLLTVRLSQRKGDCHHRFPIRR